MLRRMTIGGRLNLLIGVPLLALTLAVGVGAAAVRRANTNGADSATVSAARVVLAEAGRPPASLLLAWSEANSLAVTAGRGSFDEKVAKAAQRQLTALDTDRSALDAALIRMTATAATTPAVHAFVADTRAAETSFFDIVDNQLRPAVSAHDGDAVRTAVLALEPSYEAQRIVAGRVAAWANVQVLTHQQVSNSAVRDVVIFGGAAVVLVVLLTLLLSVRVRRAIVRAEKATLDRAEAAAAAQAAAQQAVADNMVDIARRNQALLGRTLGYISDLERDERDSDSLEHLFRLDHLATRMRRNAQSLLVLSGSEPSRQHAEPVAMGDVVRAALSEIEHYTQVEVGDVGAVRVMGTAAADLSHLLAELLENATTFSPPTTPVTVIGRTVADGHQLAVYDQGIGMSADEIAAANSMLSSPSSPVAGHGRRLGFQVVARLAERHGIRVSLAATPGGSGVTVIVRIPSELIERQKIGLPHDSGERRVPTLPLVAPPLAPAADVVPLVKRVPGASVLAAEEGNLPRLPDRPTPDQIRSSLAGLQRGVALARDEEQR